MTTRVEWNRRTCGGEDARRSSAAEGRAEAERRQSEEDHTANMQQLTRLHPLHLSISIARLMVCTYRHAVRRRGVRSRAVRRRSAAVRPRRPSCVHARRVRMTLLVA
jgi:hypothetical protein